MSFSVYARGMLRGVVIGLGIVGLLCGLGGALFIGYGSVGETPWASVKRALGDVDPLAQDGEGSSDATGDEPHAASEPERTRAEEDPRPLRVLFVGNSHTFMNDMPQMIAELAHAAGERPLYPKLIARGGARLADHVADGHAAATLGAGRWDALVLQEQQQYLSFGREQRLRDTHAPAQLLDIAAKTAGARTVITMGWARREGDPHNQPGDTFQAMHERLAVGHRELASALSATLAPVGIAWKAALDARPELPLYRADGSHAAPLGSYLAACMLYRALYGKSPSGNAFTAGLPIRDVAFVQELAATIPME